MTDSLAKFLSALKNGQKAKKPSAVCLSSKYNLAVLDLLYLQGYVRGYKSLEGGKIEVFLKYSLGEPAIKELRQVSRPSCKVYIKAKHLPKICTRGDYILSTSKGFLTVQEAIVEDTGGEVLFQIN